MNQSRYGYESSAKLQNMSINFSKNGRQVKLSIDGVIERYKKEIASHTAKIDQICKDRDLDPNEVIEAGTDSLKVESYSNKAMSSVPARTNSILKALQEDLNMLRAATATIESRKGDIENLLRIQRNIELDREFDLSYQELVDFGF